MQNFINKYKKNKNSKMTNVLNDISKIYLKEILKPELGKNTIQKSNQGEVDKKTDGQQSSEKRVIQAVYDIRYRARREAITVEQAFNQYMTHTSMGSQEKDLVREKLGLTAGSSVKEDAPPGVHYLRVVPKRGTGEKSYTRKFDPANKKDREKRHKLEQRGIKTYMTKKGDPYDYSSNAGEKFEKKYGPETGKNTVGDRDKDGTVEPDRHEYAGVKDKAIKKAMSSSKKLKKVSEEYSNWRIDLKEIVSDKDISSEKEEQIKEKKISNKIDINPKLSESVKKMGGSLLDVSQVDEALDVWHPDTEKEKVTPSTARKIEVKQKKAKVNPSPSSYLPPLSSLKSLKKEEIEPIEEKITAKTDMGSAIRDFESSKSERLAGRTKEQRRQAAIAAVLTARRGGKKLGEALDSKIQDQPNTTADDRVRRTQSDAVKKQQLANLKAIQQKQQMLQRQKLNLQKSGKLPLESSYQPEGEMIDERRRGDELVSQSPPEVQYMKRQIRKAEGRPTGQRKKPLARSVSKGGVPDPNRPIEEPPVQRIKKQLERKRKPESSRDIDTGFGIRGYRSGD